MPFARPTARELVDQQEREFDARIPGADSRLRRSVLRVIARVTAAVAYHLYGYLDFIQRQVMPDTAEQEFLDRWASIWGVVRKAATFATGSVDLTGQDGSAVPAGTVLQRSDGVEYAVDAQVVIAAGVATLAVTARSSGVAGNAAAASSMSFQSPIAGVDSSGTVAAGGITGGDDEETDAALLARLLARIQQPPHGGAEHDYVAWALEVAGVTRAWVLPGQLGPGTVGVTFVRDDDAGSIIPDAAEVQEVQDYIDDATRRPVTADVTVFAPTPVTVDFTIHLDPDTAAVRAAVQAELEDLLRREAEPGGTLLLSHIQEAISLAAGENDHVLTVPAADVTVLATEIAVMGTITWV